MKHLLSILLLLSVIGINHQTEAYEKTYEECWSYFCTDIFEAVRKGRIDFVNRYIAARADVNALSFVNKFTPLQVAAYYNRLKIAEILVNNGANLNIPSSSGWTPLHWAVKQDHFEMAQFLVIAGADVNVEDVKGRIPLHYARKNKNEEMIKLLINARVTR